MPPKKVNTDGGGQLLGPGFQVSVTTIELFRTLGQRGLLLLQTLGDIRDLLRDGSFDLVEPIAVTC